jgi:sugar lactone lactonase YvrE
VRLDDGFPDGMCIDDDGCLWVAVWGGSAVHRFGPDGTLLAVVEVAAPQVSSCCLGGTDGRTLFVTTSQEGMDDATRAAHPGSGHVFAARVDVPGAPAAMFAGVAA